MLEEIFAFLNVVSAVVTAILWFIASYAEVPAPLKRQAWEV